MQHAGLEANRYVQMALRLMHQAEHEDAASCESLEEWKELHAHHTLHDVFRSFVREIVDLMDSGLDSLLSDAERPLFKKRMLELVDNVWLHNIDTLNPANSKIKMRELLQWSRLVALIGYACRAVERAEARLFLGSLTLIPLVQEDSFESLGSAGLSTQQDAEWLTSLHADPFGPNIPEEEIKRHCIDAWRRLRRFVSQAPSDLETFAVACAGDCVSPQVKAEFKFVDAAPTSASDEGLFTVLLPEFVAWALRRSDEKRQLRQLYDSTLQRLRTSGPDAKKSCLTM
ncbi:MAG: hypothetical protein MHM6MM_003821 [Cercozoa sp. M6MM]